MPSWLERFTGRRVADEGTGDTDTVRRIAGELDRLEPDRARYLAAFAYVLSRAARADLRISEAESLRMTDIVQRIGNLSDSQATLVVEIAKAQSRIFGGTEDFLVTREFRDISTAAQRAELLDCLLAIAAADAGISTAEESEIGKVARELGITHEEFITALQAWSSERTVLRKPDTSGDS